MNKRNVKIYLSDGKCKYINSLSGISVSRMLPLSKSNPVFKENDCYIMCGLYRGGRSHYSLGGDWNAVQKGHPQMGRVKFTRPFQPKTTKNFNATFEALHLM